MGLPNTAPTLTAATQGSSAALFCRLGNRVTGRAGSTTRSCFQVPSSVFSQPCCHPKARMAVGASPSCSPNVTASLPPRSLGSPLNLRLSFTTPEKQIIEQTLISAFALVKASVSTWPKVRQRWGGGKGSWLQPLLLVMLVPRRQPSPAQSPRC